MSWAEIKKAVNGKMERPLDEMFGLEFVRDLTNGATVTGMQGVIIIAPLDTNIGGGRINIKITDSFKNTYTISAAQSYYDRHVQSFPINKDESYEIIFVYGNDLYLVRLYAYGGGYLTTIRKPATLSERRCA